MGQLKPHTDNTRETSTKKTVSPTLPREMLVIEPTPIFFQVLKIPYPGRFALCAPHGFTSAKCLSNYPSFYIRTFDQSRTGRMRSAHRYPCADRYRELNIMNRLSNKDSGNGALHEPDTTSFSDVFHPCMQGCPYEQNGEQVLRSFCAPTTALAPSPGTTED